MQLHLKRFGRELARMPVNPEQMADIAYLIYKGWSDESIAKQLKLPVWNIQEIRMEHPETAAAHKEFVISKLNEFVARGVERICDEVDEMHIDKLPLALGIIIDKAQLLQGQATTRVDTTKGISQEKLLDILEGMKRAKKPVIEDVRTQEQVVADLEKIRLQYDDVESESLEKNREQYQDIESESVAD